MADQRLGTGAARMQMGGARVGTAARMGTAMREVNYTGVGYNTKINAVDRPVTNHGMTGITAVKGGPGRQIYDRTYFYNLLKSKNGAIMGEITKMKQEVEDINKDNSTYLSLERKYETLIKDVRKYEGELADYNLALDKHRSDTKPDDIEALYMHIKNQNDKQKAALDNLFTEKREMENELQSYEQQIQDINYANESKLNDLDPEQRNDYEKLKGDNQGLQIQINENRNQLEQVGQRLMQAEATLKQDNLKQRAQHLREEKNHLTKRKSDLELQTNEMNLPFPEARERLMNRIKSENQEIKQLEKELTEARKIIDTYQRNIKEIDSDMNEKKDGDGDQQKYEILYQKEKQINEFIQNFEEEKTQYEADIGQKQKVIAGLLEHISKTLARQTKLPNAGDVGEMKADLNFKKRQLDDAENTAAKLQVEVDTRTGDLQKIKNLENRIDNELQQVTEGIDKMEDEIHNKFTKSDDLQSQFEEEKASLVVIRRMVNQYKNGLQKQVTYHNMKHDTKKNQLFQSDIFQRLNEIEKRLIGNESQIYAINQFIEARSADTNYHSYLQDCMQMCHDVNQELIKKTLGSN